MVQFTTLKAEWENLFIAKNEVVLFCKCTGLRTTNGCQKKDKNNQLPEQNSTASVSKAEQHKLSVAAAASDCGDKTG